MKPLDEVDVAPAGRGAPRPGRLLRQVEAWEVELYATAGKKPEIAIVPADQIALHD